MMTENMIEEISVHEALERYARGAMLVDVREIDEIAELAFDIADLKILPLSQLEQRYSELPADQTIVMLCKGGARSLKAAKIMKSVGHEQVLSMRGGMIDWVGNHLPVKRAQAAHLA